MSTSVLFPKNIYNLPSVNSIPLYCTLTETHAYESRTSQYPVQSGSTIIDNVIQSPTVITMRILVSDTPIEVSAPRPVTKEGDPPTTEYTGTQGLISITTMEALIRIQELRQPCTLVTGIKVYENMVLTKMDIPRTERTGRALFFDLEFSEIMVSQVSVDGSVIDPKYVVSTRLSDGTITPPFPKNASKEAEDRSITTITNRAVEQFSPLEKLGAWQVKAVNKFKEFSVKKTVQELWKRTGIPTFGIF